jgi:hypothetical protein
MSAWAQALSVPKRPSLRCLLSLCFPQESGHKLSWEEALAMALVSLWSYVLLTRVNSANVLDERLKIGGIGHRMNSKVKISQTRRISRINMVINLAYSQFVPDRPLLAPIYRWLGLKEPVGSNTYYNVCIRHELVL